MNILCAIGLHDMDDLNAVWVQNAELGRIGRRTVCKRCPHEKIMIAKCDRIKRTGQEWIGHMDKPKNVVELDRMTING